MKLSDRMYYVWLDVATMMLKLNNNGEDVASAIANADALVEAATERFAWITAPDKEPDVAPEVEPRTGGTVNG